jgi:hypothetical protein
MTMTFEIPSGRHVKAHFDQELVELLRHDGLGLPPSSNAEEFMIQLAAYALEHQNVTIRTDTTGHFLFDLQQFGILKHVDDPWNIFVIDGISWGLRGPMAPAHWRHQLIWSHENPVVISSHASGITIHRPINTINLTKTGYQEQWLMEHLAHMRRLA